MSDIDSPGVEELDELSARYLPDVLTAISPRADEKARLCSWLTELAQRWDEEQTCDRWSFLAYAMTPFAELPGTDIADLIERLKRLEASLRTLGEAGRDGTIWVQRGVPAIAASAKQHPDRLDEALQLTFQIADQGIDPAHLAALVIPKIISQSDGDEGFSNNLRCCLEFVDGLHSVGITALYTFSVGIQSIIGEGPLDGDRFTSEIADLRELVIGLREREISPYATVEYGIAQAFDGLGESPYRASIFNVALPLAEHGENPQWMLQDGLTSIYRLGPTVCGPVIQFAEQLAAEGISQPDFFISTAPELFRSYENAGLEPDQQIEKLRSLTPILRQLRAPAFQPFLLFKYGFAEALRTGDIPQDWIDDARELAVRLMELEIDPGPVFRLGLTSTWHGLNKIAAPRSNEIWRAVMQGCRELMEAGLSPMALLKSGLPILLDVEDPSAPRALQRLESLLDMIRDCSAYDIDADSFFQCGLAAVKYHQNGGPLLDLILANLQDLLQALHAGTVDPSDTLVLGIPSIAEARESNPEALVEAFDFAVALADNNIDPAPYLQRGLPQLVAAVWETPQHLTDTLDRLASLALELPSSTATPLPTVIEKLSSYFIADPTLVEFTSSRLLVLAHEGIDATTCMAFALPAAVDSALSTAAIIDALEDLLRQTNDAAPGAQTLFRYLVPTVIENFDDEGLLDFLVEALPGVLDTEWAGDDELRDTLFRQTASAVATLAPNLDAFIASYLELEFHDSQAARKAISIPTFTLGQMIATSNEAQPLERFWRLLKILESIAAELKDSPGLNDDGLNKLLTTASMATGGDPPRIEAILNDWSDHLQSPAMKEQFPALLQRLYFLLTSCQAPKDWWQQLLAPTIHHHGARALWLVAIFTRARRSLRSVPARRLLRRIVTERGVEAADLIEGFILPALRDGIIEDISAEEEVIDEFINEFPAHLPEMYETYRAISSDPDLDRLSRQAAIDELIREFTDLRESIQRGELTDQQLENPLSATALFHTFPPAVTVPRTDYLRLVQDFDDHNVDGPTIECELLRGGYRVRPGEEIVAEPFEIIADALHPPISIDEELVVPWTELGEKLFTSWLAGDLRSDRNFSGLLRAAHGIYCQSHAALPKAPTGLEEMMEIGEFLGDPFQEILQEALQLHREQDRDTYDRLASHKLAPPAHVGKGLIAMVTTTVSQFQEDMIDEAEARRRLLGQLRRFDTADSITEIIHSPVDQLPRRLERLPSQTTSFTPGEETTRILKDLVGQEFAAISRELYGDSEQPAKIELHHQGTDTVMPLRFQITKRRAHAPIGFCEGVCTARDRPLWNSPNFFQTIIWGPEARALGGVHVLVVEQDEDTPESKRLLLLPGINPSRRLLLEVGSAAILDAVLHFGAQLAHHWDADQLAIPTHPGVFTNRHSIHSEMNRRDFPTIPIEPIIFGHRYRYTLDKVFVIDGEAPPSCAVSN